VENARTFAAMSHPTLEFRDAWVVGAQGLQTLASTPAAEDEERWLVLMAQHPEAFGHVAGKLLSFLRRRGIRVLYYAYDEATRSL